MIGLIHSLRSSKEIKRLQQHVVRRREGEKGSWTLKCSAYRQEDEKQRNSCLLILLRIYRPKLTVISPWVATCPPYASPRHSYLLCRPSGIPLFRTKVCPMNSQEETLGHTSCIRSRASPAGKRKELFRTISI
ncbi:hypothetical protein lerEdw1_011968 [Lerista edwardsae]|nr:hypothetical protein lerEdw1_011968 [Lerista edwardsae]